jgi:hypothetical protein
MIYLPKMYLYPLSATILIYPNSTKPCIPTAPTTALTSPLHLPFVPARPDQGPTEPKKAGFVGNGYISPNVVRTSAVLWIKKDLHPNELLRRVFPFNPSHGLLRGEIGGSLAAELSAFDWQGG